MWSSAFTSTTAALSLALTNAILAHLRLFTAFREIIVLSSLRSYHPLLNILSMAPWFPCYVKYLSLVFNFKILCNLFSPIQHFSYAIITTPESLMLPCEIRRQFVPSPTLSLRLPKNLGHCQPSHQSLKFSSDTTSLEKWAKLGHWCTELNEQYKLPHRHNFIQ